MKIQYASDLHLEFPQNSDFLKANPLQAEGDILILAGDIVPFTIMEKHGDFFDYVSDHFKATYWIPGNHEYYHFNLAEKCGVIDENIRSNVHLVNNKTLHFNDTRIIFSTMWSRISELNAWRCENGVNDFFVIEYNGRRFSVNDFNNLHQESLEFITTELDKKTDDKTIVVSHHVPTLKNYPEEYLNSSINEVFTVELSKLILDKQPNFWIYGHHHRNIPTFKFGKTEMRTNQLGYVKYNEHTLFNNKKVIAI